MTTNLGIIGAGVVVSAPWTPASVAGLTGWWDASNTGTITDTGGYVTLLTDLSGNGKDLDSTYPSGPTTGTRTQNGLNVLDFTPGNGSYLKHDAWTQTTQCTYFFVCQTDTLTTDSSTLRALIGWQNITNHQGSGIAMNTGSQLCMYAGSMVAGAGISANTPTQYTAVFDSASSHLDKDGVAGGTIDPGDDDFNGGGPLQIGDVWDYSGGGHGSYSVRWDGWLGEFLIYEGVVGAGDRATIEAYLKAKWGTP